MCVRDGLCLNMNAALSVTACDKRIMEHSPPHNHIALNCLNELVVLRIHALHVFISHSGFIILCNFLFPINLFSVLRRMKQLLRCFVSNSEQNDSLDFRVSGFSTDNDFSGEFRKNYFRVIAKNEKIVTQLKKRKLHICIFFPSLKHLATDSRLKFFHKEKKNAFKETLTSRGTRQENISRNK